MDSSRFDDLSRTLATGFSRRATLTGIAAALLGVIGLRSGAGAQVTQAQCGNKTCRNNPGRCNDGCVCCVYANGNSRCRPPGSCSPGTETCPEDRPLVDPVRGCIEGCPPFQTPEDGCQDTCVGLQCELNGDAGCTRCAAGAEGSAFCLDDIDGDCALTCTSNADCAGSGFSDCLRADDFCGGTGFCGNIICRFL